ncbi:hypothetical protein [Streptococcus equi]|uniref:hypothetical protein n=1 Tax=Streptococcus equi TaxID=1336 RepID=UPI002F2B70EB
MKAPKSFDIRDFQVTFVFDITEKGELTSQLIFDYGSIQISDKASLDQLPFASHYKKKQYLSCLEALWAFSAVFC